MPQNGYFLRCCLSMRELSATSMSNKIAKNTGKNNVLFKVLRKQGNKIIIHILCISIPNKFILVIMLKELLNVFSMKDKNYIDHSLIINKYLDFKNMLYMETSLLDRLYIMYNLMLLLLESFLLIMQNLAFYVLLRFFYARNL